MRQAVRNGHAPSVTAPETAPPDLAARVDLVAKLQGEIVAKAAAEATWQAQAARLARQLAAANARLAELGSGETVSVDTGSTPRPWWARWAWWRH